MGKGYFTERKAVATIRKAISKTISGAVVETMLSCNERCKWAIGFNQSVRDLNLNFGISRGSEFCFCKAKTFENKIKLEILLLLCRNKTSQK